MIKTIITFSMIMVLAVAARSQIIFTNEDPDIIVDTWDAKELDIDKDGSADINLWFHPWGADANVQAVSFKEVELLGSIDSNEFYPFALEQDSIIDSTATKWQNINGKYVNLSRGGNKGNWIGKTEKYLAFRMKKSGQWLYGWIMLTVEGATLPTAFIIHEYAYQSGEGQGIKAGEKEATTGVNICRQNAENAGLFFNTQASSLMIRTIGTAGKLTVYDMAGRNRLQIQNPGNYPQPVDLSWLEKGFYIAVYKKENKVYSLKIDKL